MAKEGQSGLEAITKCLFAAGGLRNADDIANKIRVMRGEFSRFTAS